MNSEARLIEAGIAHPRRALRVMEDAIARLSLDLGGLNIVTEAGTGVYALTPVIAAMAGANNVRAIVGDSPWGPVAVVRETVTAALELAGLAGRVELTEERAARTFAEADIITNLGFVRPIDAGIVASMKPTAVVALMCEAWEARPGDVDVDACHRRGVLVLGTNEHHPLCDVFRYSGPLAGQMLFDAGFELLGTRVVVVGSDRFAPVISAWLRRAGADASHVMIGAADTYEQLRDAEVVLIAHYATDDVILGDGATVDVRRLVAVAPAAVVLQFAGAIDVSALRRECVSYWPACPAPSRRMVRTFSALGCVPVIRLHAAGLKVGELGARARLDGHDDLTPEATAASTGLAERVDSYSPPSSDSLPDNQSRGV